VRGDRPDAKLEPATSPNAGGTLAELLTMVATRKSSSALRHRTQPSRSYPLGPQADEDDSETPVSEYSDGVRGSAVDPIPRVSRKYPVEHCRETNRRMPSDTSRRRQSEGKRRSSKEPTVEVREVREVHRKGGSERRHSEQRATRKEDGEVVYVYKTHRTRKEEEEDRPRTTVKRRSTTTGEASRTRHERSYKDRESSRRYVEEREPLRRHSERRASRQDERPPLRREKRSISDNVPRSTRDRAPITRYTHYPKGPGKPKCKTLTLFYRSASVRESGPAPILRPILQRSQTSARRPKAASHTAPTSPRVVENVERAPSVVKINKGGDRSSGIFGSFFAPIASKPSRPAKRMPSERRYVKSSLYSDNPPSNIEIDSSA